MTTKKNHWREATTYMKAGLGILAAPAVLIGVFTPLAIDAVNKVVIAAVSRSQSGREQLAPLLEAMTPNTWPCAALDVKIQVYAAIVGLVLAFASWAEHAPSLWLRTHQPNSRLLQSPRIARAVTLGVYLGLLYFLVAAFFGIKIVLGLTPEYIAAYKPSCAANEFPPLTSLTYLRMSIVAGTLAAFVCRGAAKQYARP